VGVPAVPGRTVGWVSRPDRGAASPLDGRRVVTPDRSTDATRRPWAAPDPESPHAPRRAGLEVALQVWERSLELAGSGRHDRLPDQALALSRAAGHNADTMAHALRLGRSRARHPSTDETTLGGVRLLERANAYLGGRADGKRHEEAVVLGPIEPWMGDDDLSRQRRKRDARLLDGQVPGHPGTTVGELVADVLAASHESRAALDVPHYLLERGHTPTTATTIVGYLQRHRLLQPIVGQPGPPAPGG
jgi:hypothetical protein